MTEAMRVLLAAAGVLLATLAMAEDPPLPAFHPLETSEMQEVRVALVDSGVNYQLEAINSRLARRDDGSLIGYDFWDMDELPFDANPDALGNVERHEVSGLLSVIRNRFGNGAAPQRLKSGFLYAPQYDPRHKIKVSETHHWQASEPLSNAVLELPLDVMLLDEQWKVKEVSEILEQAQTLLIYCGIRFADVQLRRVSAPDYLQDLETGASRTMIDAVRLSGAERRVAVVFARDTRMSTPFDAEAFGKGNTRTRAWLTDSVWLTLALQDRDIALAHELIHVLGNSGNHVQTKGNLMLKRTIGHNRTLEPEQCELARSHSLRAGLTYRINP